MIQPQVDMLLQYFGREVDELVRAREEYFLQTGGEVHADDRCYEQRMQAFFNWFLFDLGLDHEPPSIICTNRRKR